MHTLYHPQLISLKTVELHPTSCFLLMVLGYFLYESTVLGYGLGALASVSANLIQAAGGALLAAVLYRMLMAMPQLKHFQSKEG